MSEGVPAGEAVNHNPMADRDLNWLVHQLEAWPRRVDPDFTTNVQYLMRAAAKHIRATPINTPTPTPPIEGRDADVERVIHGAIAEWCDGGPIHPHRLAGLSRRIATALQALGERG